ncbi:hypothetical protein [Pseudonocardia sp. 73-21]|uniref:hypothetical protein n=1 Tax=Pseudonocardia sp. 73-21 TaxID=1895809 RepID=UPI000960DF73|nr:hypothetical protein [Pseudonocardia sp. 73-21]OJY44370.1 MAG: hypothetical protein BGP03_16405 [Pseudonocardia sp. 73-21]
MLEFLVGWLGLAVLSVACVAAGAADVTRERVHDEAGRPRGSRRTLRAVTMATAVLGLAGLILTVLRLAAFA